MVGAAGRGWQGQLGDRYRSSPEAMGVHEGGFTADARMRGHLLSAGPKRHPPADPPLRAGPAARIPGDAVQPGGEHQHRRHPLLAAQRLSSGRHPAGSVSPQAVGLRRCLGDDPGASGGANPVKVVPLRLESRG